MDRATPLPDRVIPALALRAERARALAHAICGAGLAARPETDLETALDAGDPLLVVDPAGWEDSCRVALEAFETREHPPPCVIFASHDPGVFFSGGPAATFLSEPLDRGAIALHATRGLKARERFASYWPAPLGRVSPSELKRVHGLLERATGLAMRSDREAAFLDAVRVRMVARLIPTLREYAEYLERHGNTEAEYELLAGQLVVGETYFWRYSGQFRALQTVLLPEVTRTARPRRLRVWSAGCASGEEAYSLAMACLEVLDASWELEVVGTDIHRPSLARAEAGVYRGRSLRNLPPLLSNRYTEACSGARRVREELRRKVRFACLNLGSEHLPAWIDENGPFDAIFCRNTLIYFSRGAADRVLSSLEAGLENGGGLFLGASESIQPPRGSLKPVRATGSFFYRKETPLAVKTEPPESAGREPPDSLEIEVAELYGRGLGLLDLEDFDGAREAFHSILALRADDRRGHTGLALLLANEGREAEASRQLKGRPLAGPELAETQYLLGLIEERSGREQEALLHYRRALAVDPGFYMAHFNRAWILKRMGRERAFLDEMHRALGILRATPHCAPWLTGGLGLEALLSLIAEAIEEKGRAEDG